MPGKDHRRGVAIYRAAEAVDLSETDFMKPVGTPSEAAQRVSERIGAGAAAGAQLKVLVRDANGFSLLHIWFKENYPLPRHSHDVDCMYYVISGSAVMGNQTLRAGDSFLIPAGAPYRYSAGPDGVEVLEIRHGAERFDIQLVEDSPAQWDALAEVVEANQEHWSQRPVSPTFAANAS